MPSMIMYMEKLDGKYAAEAWNIPGLDSIMIMNHAPTLGLRLLDIVENRRASQQEHVKANMVRMK